MASFLSRVQQVALLIPLMAFPGRAEVRTLRLVLISGFLVLLSVAVDAREFNVALGVQDARPLSLPADPTRGAAQSGGLTGFNEALAREICRRAAARCKFSYLSFGEILSGVESAKFDLGFGNFLRTPEREKQVSFSSSIWRSSSRLLAKPDVALRKAIDLRTEVTIETLRNARVAVVDGTLQQVFLVAIASERGLQVMPYKTMAEVITALREDRADFLLMPTLSTFALVNRESAGSFEFVGPAVADRGLGGSVHIAIPRQKEDVLLAVNQAIAGLRADGTFQRIVRQFFPFSLD